MNKLLMILILIFPITTFSKDIIIGDIDEYYIMSHVICSSIKDGDIVKLNSGGGYASVAIDIANCVHNKDIILEVTEGSSSAFYIILAANKVCFNKGAEFGLHSYSPVNVDDIDDVKDGLEYDINQLRYFYSNDARWLLNLGYTGLQVYSIIGISLLTPSNSLTMLNHAEMATILGDRYIGYCKK